MTLRRTLLLGGLLLAAVGAIIHWRGPLEQKAREQWHAWKQPDIPADPGGPVSAARPSADGATLETQDPPPYDRPSLLRSGMSIAIGDHRVRPNMHFDFEVTSDTTKISHAHARSGVSAQVIRSGTEYAPAIRRRAAEVADTLTAVAVGLWLFTKAEKPPVTIVVSVDRGDKQLAWFGKDMYPAEHEPGKWQHFQAQFFLRDVVVTGDDQVSIYLWNREKERVYIDDMDVVFRSRQALGRAHGIAFDLEDSTHRIMPLPFAQVAFHSEVDPSSFGVMVGKEAPLSTITEVPLSPGSALRWRYAPGDAVARVVGGDGKDVALVRAWCIELGCDPLGYERVVVAPGSTGLRMVAFDVDMDASSGRATVAKTPPPRGVELIITAPTP
ncbi:MAG: hypothetical protein IPK99_10405 [Flavobacteriales bacterium]|nr:hypothetical protein [Flavobacteriales bacterium]